MHIYNGMATNTTYQKKLAYHPTKIVMADIRVRCMHRMINLLSLPYYLHAGHEIAVLVAELHHEPLDAAFTPPTKRWAMPTACVEAYMPVGHHLRDVNVGL